MKKRIIYRKPWNNQDQFVIASTYKKTKHESRSKELCEELYINRVSSCDEATLATIAVEDEALFPEKLRRKVYAALIQGAKGIEYNSVFDNGITKDSQRGSLFRYLEELNYRITQYGRTLMALQPMGIYCAADVVNVYPELANKTKQIGKSKVLARQELPTGLVIGEFSDEEGNCYLMYQNMDCATKTAKAFQVGLKKAFRAYRVNPHTGQQMLVKDSIDVQKILIMPGDADILRYQDVKEEACLIEYALRK